MTTTDFVPPAPSRSIRPEFTPTRVVVLAGALLLAVFVVLTWGALRDPASAEAAPAVATSTAIEPGSTPPDGASGPAHVDLAPIAIADSATTSPATPVTITVAPDDDPASPDNSGADITIAIDCSAVTVTSTKDISNIVVNFADGTSLTLEGLSGHSFTRTFDRTVVSVIVKSGTTTTSANAPACNPPAPNPASVGDTVFSDTNANGTQDAGEPGIAGVVVTLLSGTTPVATTTTDAAGHYSFVTLAPGAYVVDVAGPAGLVLTTGNDSTTVTLAPGEARTDVDFGFVAPPVAPPADLPPVAPPADLPPVAPPADLPPVAPPADLPPVANLDAATTPVNTPLVVIAVVTPVETPAPVPARVAGVLLERAPAVPADPAAPAPTPATLAAAAPATPAATPAAPATRVAGVLIETPARPSTTESVVATQAAAGTLPRTGHSVGGLLAAGMSLILAGTMVVGVGGTRRRRRAPQAA